MSTNERTPAIVPDHLRNEYIGTMRVDTPRYVHPSFIYDDKDGRLYVDTTDYLAPATTELHRKKGRVAIMLALLDTGETGYVADLRHISSGRSFNNAASDTAPDDNEDFAEWQQDKENERPICAVISHTRDGDVRDGDPDFFDAVTYLADQTDIQIRKLKRKERRQEPPQPPYTFTARERFIDLPVLRIKEFFGLL